jgi:hypothetical protein
MDHNKPLSYAMSGDLGDIIYSMRTCHQLNDPNSTYYIVDRPFTKPWNQARLDALVPLMEAQPYLGRVVYEEPKESLTHDFIDFRRGALTYSISLADIHATWVGIKLNPYTPWLKVNPSNEMNGKVIVHKSPRYANPKFPWRAMADKFGDRMVAVGVEDELHVLVSALGRQVPLRKTSSYLELAELMAGCDLFIGNQSSPCAIALGLGIPTVQETSLRQPDCMFAGANAFYAWSSEVVIDGQSYGTKVQSYIDSGIVPPGGWIVYTEAGTRIHSTSIGTVASQLMREIGVDRQVAMELILEQNTERVRRDYPTFQPNKESEMVRIMKERGCIQNVNTNLKYKGI